MCGWLNRGQRFCPVLKILNGKISQLLERMEKAVTTAFDATLFNWGCLMNTFYLEDTFGSSLALAFYLPDTIIQ